MAKFFRSVGRGILYILFVPVIIVIVALGALAGIGVFFYQFFKNMILFFQGKSVLKDLPEDKQARAILDVNKDLSKQILANQLNSQTGEEKQESTNTTTNNIFIVGGNANPEDIQKLLNGDTSAQIDKDNVVEQQEDVPQIEGRNAPLLSNILDNDEEDIIPDVELENKDVAIVKEEKVSEIPSTKEKINVNPNSTTGFMDEDEDIDDGDSGISIRSK
ncbi:MAG: hypothetical protein LUD22_02685 [Coprobacillus sp.]|nr:hypothetical protein [Coprobacillus sp.]